MLTCPACHKALPGLPAHCYACHADLTPLRHLRALADHHFNQAVRAARARHWATASEHLARTLLLNPTDTEAQTLLTKVRHHQHLADRTPRQRRGRERGRGRGLSRRMRSRS
ncbi:hypothetical protein DY218_10195 [Streptomyces triticagri]|uniref:Uncharacterized protein n=1 Tax=Streptomyces triticagri TaxID=2293568 RepID=A0A372M8K5_9ACTN|nr:hypothetical protein [Streptomyces triticagri]RFU86835.1 hypothetical protein DY218_10195 [Streptomyces triticagri]